MRKGKFTEEEQEYFLKHYPTSYNEDLSKMLGRSIDALSKRACFYEVKKELGYTKKRIKGVVQVDYYTGKELMFYETMQEAALDNFVSRGTVAHAVRHTNGVMDRHELKFIVKKKVSSCEKEPFRPKI